MQPQSKIEHVLWSSTMLALVCWQSLKHPYLPRCTSKGNFLPGILGTQYYHSKHVRWLFLCTHYNVFHR